MRAEGTNEEGPSALSTGAAPPATAVAEVIGYALGECDCALKVAVFVRLRIVVDEAVALDEAFLAMNEKEREPGV